MGQFTFRLDFWESGPKLTLRHTVFAREGGDAFTANEGEDFKWLTGVIALSIVMLRFRLGELVLFATRPSPETSLYDALASADQKLYWLDGMFHLPSDDGPAGRFRQLLTPSSHTIETGPRRDHTQEVKLSLNEHVLPRCGIQFTLNDRPLVTQGELQDLHRKLVTEYEAQSRKRVAGRKTPQWDLDLRAELAARYSTRDRPVEFHVVAGSQDLAAGAACVLHETIKHLVQQWPAEVWVGVTGGVIQAGMAKHTPRIRPATDATAITVVPMNNMGRFEQPERSTADVARELGKSLHGDHRWTLSPEHWAEFADKLAVCLISGGERSRSYIAEEVRTAHGAVKAFCQKAVGDINGHLLDADGGVVKCPKVEKILRDRQLYCPLDPGTLRTLADDPTRSVIAVLSDRALGPTGADGAGASKCPLALACLRGGYANVYVIGSGLARELLAVPPTTSLTVRRRVV